MAWNNYPKKRVHRGEQPVMQQPQPQPVMAQPDMTDADGNGYPDVFDAEETQLLAQIALRRKQYGYKKQVEAYSGIGDSSSKNMVGSPELKNERDTIRQVLGY